MSEFTSAYALARHVAHQLPQHNGKSARELYQAFLPEFSALGADGSTGSTMINQHLRKLEDEGLVISEKSKVRGNPSKWFWVGQTYNSQESEPEPNALQTKQVEEAVSQTSIEPHATAQEIPDDPWDELARQFAAACREQAAADRSIDGIEHLASKLGVIDKLIQIMSEDVREVLGAIATDLVNIGGIDK